MMSALPSNFLDRLLSTALMEDAEIRLFVLEILISFIDRHGNRHKFSTIRWAWGLPSGRRLPIGPHTQVGGQFRYSVKLTRELITDTDGPAREEGLKGHLCLGGAGAGLEIWEIKSSF